MTLSNCTAKKICIACVIFIFILNQKSFSQNVGINNPTPDASSLLDLTSNSKGLLVPRMTTIQRNVIATPATGLLVYDSTLNQFYYYDGTQWRPIFTTTNGWGLPGNAGTNSAVNFVGTSDNQALNFRVNNLKSGTIDHVNHNTSLGFLGFNTNTTGYGNVAIGDSTSYYSNSWYNTVLGQNAGINNTGSWTTIIGIDAGRNNTANGNVFIGSSTGRYNTTGLYNMAVGNNALVFNTTGTHLTAGGNNSMRNNTTGNYNTAYGAFTLYTNTIGIRNSAFGTSALYFNAGSDNTSMGFESLNSNTTGIQNVAVGSN
ncbi:MAG: hypothetical protein ABI855_01435, partial [Bacteroidota bacterium]